MAKIPFLSRLFGTEPQDRKEEAEGAVPAPEPVGQKTADPPPEPTLQLPPEHALNKLWRLYLEQGGQASAPVLRLRAPGAEPLPRIRRSRSCFAFR